VEITTVGRVVASLVVDSSVVEVAGTIATVLFSEDVVSGSTVTDDAETVVDADSAVTFVVEADVGRMTPVDPDPVIPDVVSIVAEEAVVGPVNPEVVSIE
jgi:hypothetical protein